MKGNLALALLLFCLPGCVGRLPIIPVGAVHYDESHLRIVVENPSPYEVTVRGAINKVYPPHSRDDMQMPCEGNYRIVEEVQKIIAWDDDRNPIERYYMGERVQTFWVSPKSYNYNGESIAARVVLGQGFSKDPNNLFGPKEIPLLTPPPCGITGVLTPTLKLKHTPGVQMRPRR